MTKFEIYKWDKWNMVHAEVKGKKITVRVISDQWGEDCHTFLSRPQLMNWVEQYYAADRFQGTEEERETIISRFREV
ncbi:hypothetical protein [Marinicrinis sediminis]|uniref:Uncharacterized protein n=1 Tax=Marinicrinis sediminis TaxID=1652465 RepID=A0ABW5R7R9_9BACL